MSVTNYYKKEETGKEKTNWKSMREFIDLSLVIFKLLVNFLLMCYQLLIAQM